MGAQFLSLYLAILDMKMIFSLVSNLKNILNLASDPIIIQPLICSFVMFFLTFVLKRLINGVHKTNLKTFYNKWFSYPSCFYPLPNVFFSNVCKTQKILHGRFREFRQLRCKSSQGSLSISSVWHLNMDWILA